MELKETISSRRSIRKYKNESIDENIIWEALKYGVMAPSAHNRQPWKVKLVKNEEKDCIANALIDKTISVPGHTGPHTAGVIKNVPYLLMIFIDNDIKENRDMDIISIGAFIENIILYLTDMGLGTLWIANTNLISEEIKNILNVEYESVSCIGIGVKDQEPYPRPRKELDEIIL